MRARLFFKGGIGRRRIPAKPAVSIKDWRSGLPTNPVRITTGHKKNG
jgi:hypothetical protein